MTDFLKNRKMKKLIIAIIALTSFNAASFGQVVPVVKKSENLKLQIVKKTNDVKPPLKLVALNKVTTTTKAATPTSTKTKST